MSKPLSTAATIRAVRFAEVPPVGFTIEVGRARQVFTVEGYRPYTRKDGTQTQLIDWSSPCAECGELFFVSSCLTSLNNHFGNRRCEDHRKPFVRVRRKKA